MNIIFYHANCADGFAAAFAAWLKFGGSAAYVPVSYGKPVPILAGIAGDDPGPHSVFILDFSWPAAELRALAESPDVASVVVLDHHASAQRQLEGLSHPKIMVHFSTSRSGAVMAWRYFHDRQRGFFDREPLPERYFDEAEAPEMIRYVEDYDIHWPPLMKETRAVQAGLWRGQERCFHRWQYLMMDWHGIGKSVCLAAGEAILRADALTLDRLAGQVQHIAGPGGELALAVNSPVLPNEIAERLLDEHRLAEFVAVFYQRADALWKVSLRSRQGECDVAKIAERHRGGGHQSAAAFVEYVPPFKIWEMLGSAWRLISETQPAIGDIIACCAEHKDGGPMYWAGTVADVNGQWVTMVTRGECERRFFVTHDTLWMPLEKPNARGVESATTICPRCWDVPVPHEWTGAPENCERCNGTGRVPNDQAMPHARSAGDRENNQPNETDANSTK